MATKPTKGVQIYLKIDGERMPTPTKYEFTEADFDGPNAARSETGIMIRDPIRTDCHTVKCTWSTITTKDLRKIKEKIKGKASVEVEVFSPFDMENGNLLKYTAYVQATRTYGVVLPRYDIKETLWSFECSFIEY